MKEKFSEYIIAVLVLAGLTAGLVAHFFGYEGLDHTIWMVTLAVGTLPLLYKMLRAVFRGHFGVDIIAIAAITVSFFLGEYLAGTVILLMLSGGEALENYALKRSSRELTLLLSLAPSQAHKKIGTDITDIKVEEIKPEDILLIKPGETIPADGIVVSGITEVDETSITGESLPVKKEQGSLVYSGSINKDAVLEVKALKAAEESQYQRIVKLVKSAQESRAPLVRLADRYAVWFTLVAFLIAGASWFMFKDPLRFLAVLVVATPCPLILATPIAIISGISKAASRGIIVKSGGALEKLGEAKAMLFDKTGTLTLGEPSLVDVKVFSEKNKISPEEIIRLSASLDQFSAHILARSLVLYAKSKKYKLELPVDFLESLGNGVSGKLGKMEYFFGKLKFLQDKGVKISSAILNLHDEFSKQGKISVYLGTQNEILGAIIFSDVIRPEMKKVFASMQEHKLKKMIMITGDKKAVAEKIASQLGLTDFRAETLPEEKVLEVVKAKNKYGKVAMVGDGINDAPALAAADVGIALAFHGSSATSESGDIVIMQNNFMRVHDALHIAQRVMWVAKEGIFVGMGLSVVLMVIAALGYIPPVYGAMLQEVVDVAVILNALKLNFEKVE